MKKQAVVGVYIDDLNQFAVVTRHDGRICLPGGKVDEGESLLTAVLRECEEEGWQVLAIKPIPIHTRDDIDGYETHWFHILNATMLGDYKDKSRNLFPFTTDVHTLIRCSPGFGNEFLKKFLEQHIALKSLNLKMQMQ